MERIALITGAGSGIGRATAIGLSEDGWKVMLAGRRESSLKETSDLAKEGQTFIHICDVTNSEAVEGTLY